MKESLQELGIDDLVESEVEVANTSKKSLILCILKENPNCSVTEIQRQLSEGGIQATYSYICSVRSAYRRDQGIDESLTEEVINAAGFLALKVGGLKVLRRRLVKVQEQLSKIKNDPVGSFVFDCGDVETALAAVDEVELAVSKKA